MGILQEVTRTGSTIDTADVVPVALVPVAEYLWLVHGAITPIGHLEGSVYYGVVTIRPAEHQVDQDT